MDPIQHRVEDLHEQRRRAQQETDQLRTNLAEQQQAHTASLAQLEQLKAELVKTQTRAELETSAGREQRQQAERERQRLEQRLVALEGARDQALQHAAQAREEAARLSGQLFAHQEQIDALLSRLTPSQRPTQPRPKPNAST